MSMKDREKAFETKYAHDQQMLFKIEARASKLIGLWAAEKMGLSGDAAMTYAREVVASNLDEPGFDDVKRKIVGDFNSADVAVTEADIDRQIQVKHAEAARQIEDEAKA